MSEGNTSALGTLTQCVADVCQVTPALSYLPEFEPLCGLALAFNLAYLNLKMFRYRQQLAEEAIKTIQQLGVNPHNGLTGFEGFPWFKNICIIADNPLYPPDDKVPTKNLRNARWFKTLKFWFDSTADIWISRAACLFSGTILIVGVAHKIGWWQVLNTLGMGNLLTSIFALLVLCMIAPIYFVIRGKMVIDHGEAYLREKVGDSSSEVSDGLDDKMKEQDTAVKLAKDTH